MGVLCQLYTKFDSTASSASFWASSSHSTTSFASWASSSDSTATFSPLRQVDPGLCALEMAATCSRCFARVVLKIPFSSSHSKGSRCKRLVSFLAKSALMLSTGVTLSFSSIEPKICPATSIEVKFSKRWRALCLSRLSLVFRTFLLFSLFLLDIVDFLAHEGNFFDRLICAVVNLLHADWSSSCSVVIRLCASSK